jgi:hypothetical protein
MTKKARIWKTLLSSVVLGGALVMGGMAQAGVVISNVDNIAWPVNGRGLADTGYQFNFLSHSQDALKNASNIYGFDGSGYGYLTGLGNPNGATHPYCADGTSNCVLMFDYTNVYTGSATATLNVYAVNTAAAYSYVDGAWGNVDLSTYAADNGGSLFLSLKPTNIVINPVANSQYQYSMSLLPTSYMGSTGDANGTLGPDPNFFLSGTEPNSQYEYFYDGTQGFYAGAGTGFIAVPEPSDLGIMGLGLLMVGLMGLRFRQSKFRRS